MTQYNRNNTFARIIRGELPARKVAENEHAMSFHDITPLAPIHVLAIPKLPVSSLHELIALGKPEQVQGFMDVVHQTIKLLNLENKPYWLVLTKK